MALSLPANSKTVLITGGAGFIGSNLIRRLLSPDSGFELPRVGKIVVFDRLQRRQHLNLLDFSSDPRVEVINGDITDRRAIDSVTDRVEQIYHLSSIVGIKHYCEDPLEVIDVNIIGTRNVLEQALKKGIRLLFASTSEIFGKNPQVPWKEDDDRVLGSTRIERWSYSTSKAVCEHMIFALAKSKGLRCSIVRFFNVYGPKQNPIFVISQGVYRVLRNERPLLYDSGEQTRCFTYVDDAVDGMILAANADAAVGEAFNIGSNIPTSIREVNEIIIEEAGKKGRIDVEQVNTRVMYGDQYEDIPRRVPDITKAGSILRWRANVPLRKGIRMFIEWANENRWWSAPSQR